MANVVDILTNIHAAGQALHSFAQQTQPWRRLSDRLFDLRESLESVELTLESWRCKCDISARKPKLYMRVLFGKQGCKCVLDVLSTIDSAVDALKTDISTVIGLALKVKSIKISPEKMFSSSSSRYEDVVLDCLTRIRSRRSWSHNFHLCVLRKLEDLESRLDWLHMKLTSLERLSDVYIEKEHPQQFYAIKRLPGRRAIRRIGDDRRDSVQSRLLDALAARKDAELLHRASAESQKTHIGLSVPQIHKRDFAFLLNVAGKTHQVLVHPVKIKAINDPRRIQTSFASTIPILIDTATAQQQQQNACYMFPSSSTSAGFQVSLPPTNLLADLESKDALSKTIRDQPSFLGSQILWSHDQSAVAAGIAAGCFRLIGSKWLNGLDCTNIRWRRTKDGRWNSMLTAAPGDEGLTRVLEDVLQANMRMGEDKGAMDLSKHIQIFRIGLVLTELALKIPISHLEYDDEENRVNLYMPANPHPSSTSSTFSSSLSSSILSLTRSLSLTSSMWGEASGSTLGAPMTSSPTTLTSPGLLASPSDLVTPLLLAAEVERRTNVYMANMVYFCLSALNDPDAMNDNMIAAEYFKHVLKEAELLGDVAREEMRRSQMQSIIGTPIIGGFEGGSGVGGGYAGNFGGGSGVSVGLGLTTPLSSVPGGLSGTYGLSTPISAGGWGDAMSPRGTGGVRDVFWEIRG